MKQQDLIAKNINKGNIIYKRFQQNQIIDVSDMKDCKWFALESNYGEDVYGPVIHTYKFKKKPKLIDIGKMKNRNYIENIIIQDVPEFSNYSSADYQYSGGKENYRYHSYVKQYFGGKFEGTIIVEDNVDDIDLEGPTEIVLWKNFNELIEKI